MADRYFRTSVTSAGDEENVIVISKGKDEEKPLGCRREYFHGITIMALVEGIRTGEVLALEKGEILEEVLLSSKKISVVKCL